MFAKKLNMLFFKKKYFIADLLEGLIDMHCHVLPSIDDGAKDEIMSLDMLKQYEALGYKGIITTPHVMDGFYDNTATAIKNTFKEFQLYANENGYSNFVIATGAEYMMDTGFDELTQKKEILPIIANKVLVEMSFLRPSFKATEQIFNIQQQEFEPILAHPERYSYLNNVDKILEFKDKGCALQLNILALGGHYGKRATQHAFALLEKRHFEYVGTDAHHPGHFNILRQITIPKKLLTHFEFLVEVTKTNLES